MSDDAGVSRRDALKAFGGGALGLGAGKAVDNVLLGYEKNLRTQDLAAVAAERFAPSERYDRRIGDYRVLHQQETLFVLGVDTVREALSVPDGSPEEAARIDEEYSLGGAVSQLLADIRAIERGDVSFAFSTVDSFFQRIADAEPRSYTADVLRGRRRGDPETVEAFTGVDPADPQATLGALVESFREHASYDVPRYVAGSVEDNVIFGATDLRKHFHKPVDFDSLREQRGTGMFCYEFTYRSMEALHAVPAAAQTVPAVGAKVHDYRHKHVYTAVASAIRSDGDLVIPMTFVDYTHSTLYDDFGLTGVLGDGFEAYGERHRADELFWDA